MNKVELKLKTTESLEDTIELLLKSLKEDTSLFDIVLNFKGRINEINNPKKLNDTINRIERSQIINFHNHHNPSSYSSFPKKRIQERF